MIPQLLISTEPAAFESAIESYLKEHPDLKTNMYKLFPEEGKSISIEQVRILKKELLVASTRRVVIIYDFQTAKAEAQNALLKTLEDQTENNQFILCATHIGSILPTIISRCQVLDISSDDVADASDDSQMESALETVLSGSSYAFLQSPIFQATTIDEAKHIFRQILRTLHRRMQKGDRHAGILASSALEQYSLLSSNNLNPQLAIDSWCLQSRKKMVI